MSKKQLVVLWVMGIVISVALFTQAPVSFVFAILIIGSLLIYTLKLYPHSSLKKPLIILAIIGALYGIFVIGVLIADYRWSKEQEQTTKSTK